MAGPWPFLALLSAVIGQKPLNSVPKYRVQNAATPGKDWEKRLTLTNG
jgi:hypothetical protein